ncbi:RNA polymerase subunit sigma-24 [Clostridium tyrobutyricum]|uniref:RNA polymerase subunit sigma-24 n=1 Tax=Clostridium tyrobutyricum TaxID=1519 RepID=UPI0011C7EA0E|nr:RNA polymerase subunit sigma-24 [Clostridium tyrobutyricum]
MLSTKQKESIEILRRIGWGYKRIGSQIGATRDEVRCYCRSHDLMGKINVSKDKEIFITTHCKMCNKPIVQTFKGRKKVFCSEVCRRSWQKTHPRYYEHICEHCGGNFKSRNKKQKYCSHECYIRNRFWRTEDAEMILKKLLSREKVNVPQWVLELLQGGK